ncbi:hypothetical protein E2C01_060318 [Portunus trituberculatus]|uniref:Uncharacterized protein n=1 Tax=Portunus trituberculatus TaxID=210409 RepID=A0A5B7H4X0_PORTR|nr:hypothetical protein [Portunus trituberculatus]
MYQTEEPRVHYRFQDSKISYNIRCDSLEGGVGEKPLPQADGRVSTPADCQHGFDSSPPF